ncbi:hypothetical protein RFI_32255 [Reticulomyxa filosa]|uniref:Uncharacterized protein n=1 Tax=Reticulomyxa filosa TaxID=46433 RepID=X6LUS2_RETFI|nr:hypothetical protein RFI_32255 [Reticulomyxa filosa]|eukprot:ETO05141.1 hypothetical protein RFI_32255 [Reticulomyxa filosa]
MLAKMSTIFYFFFNILHFTEQKKGFFLSFFVVFTCANLYLGSLFVCVLNRLTFEKKMNCYFGCFASFSKIKKNDKWGKAPRLRKESQRFVIYLFIYFFKILNFDLFETAVASPEKKNVPSRMEKKMKGFVYFYTFLFYYKNFILMDLAKKIIFFLQKRKKNSKFIGNWSLAPSTKKKMCGENLKIVLKVEKWGKNNLKSGEKNGKKILLKIKERRKKMKIKKIKRKRK